MTTYTVYNLETGRLGPILSASNPDDIVIPENSGVIDGHVNIKEYKLDLQTMELVPIGKRLDSIHEIRTKRNQILNDYRWTVSPDSPLSEESKLEWLSYLKSLHVMLIDYNGGDHEIVWPVKPQLRY